MQRTLQAIDALSIGVAGWPLRKHEASEQPASESPLFEQRQLDQILERLQRLGEKFQQLAGANPGGVEWRSSTHFPSEFIAAEARASDLVVIGRDALSGDVYHTYDPGTIVLAAGRPVLVVPRGIRRFRPSRVLIAWKDTREARRAVRDALPFLKRPRASALRPSNLRARRTWTGSLLTWRNTSCVTTYRLVNRLRPSPPGMKAPSCFS